MRVLWQTTIASVVLFSLGFTVLSIAHPNDNGDFGLTWRTVSNTLLVVDSVDPNGAAAKAGIRKGDRLQLGTGAHNRIVIETTEPGDRLSVRVNGAASPVEVVARPIAYPVPIVELVIVIVTRVAFLVMAALIAWRRPDDPAARSLATFLAFFGAPLSIGADLAQFGPTGARFAAFVAVESMYVIGAVAVLSFACRFPHPAREGWRLNAARAAMPLGAFALAVSWIRLALIFFGNVPQRFHVWLLLPYTVTYSVILILAVGTITATYMSAKGADRVRMRWVLGTFAVGFSGLLVYFVFAPFAPHSQALQLCTLTLIAIPFGLAYVILRHRVIDIGFVVNRAVVYTAVSLVVVGTFIVFEWLLGHVVEQQSSASFILNLAAALTLGLSARYIHDRVDRYVDDLFFRQRHLAEAAIRRFAHEVALITNPDDLIAKTIDVAQRNARLSRAAFYARRNGAYFPIAATSAGANEVDENDYAVLEMRTWHSSVDIHDSQSALSGEVAFPMMVRGLLAGFLLCGPKTNHESIAPDERAALDALAHGAGIALDSLRVHIIERELALLASEGALPAGLRERLAVLGATGGDGIAF